MSDEVSIRQHVIDNMVQTLRQSGLVDEATDAELPMHEAAPKGWVFEGDEEEDATQTVGRIHAELLVFVHTTYEFDAKDPHRPPFRVGRQILAQHQRIFMEDHTRGGWAFVTLPAGNSIATAEVEPTTRGVVESRWRIKYRRKLTDPFDKG